MFTISSKTSVLFGDGTVNQTGAKAKEFGWKKVICIFDKGVKAVGIVDKVQASLSEAGIQFVDFGDCIPDPPDYQIEEAAEIARKAEVDGVVAIGGGSSMDLAKCVNILLTNPSPISKYFGLSVGLNPVKGTILIPTTAGTGSEVSAVAVISDMKNNAKIGVAGEASVAKLAIIDPSLTFNLPASITAQTGVDALTHAIEAYTSIVAGMYSDMHAEKCMELVVKNLPVVLKDSQNLQAREALSFAAMLGGMAFSDAFTHMGHCIAQSIGAVKHITHGTSCALGDIMMLDYQGDATPEKTRRIGEILGLDLPKDLSANELAQKVKDGFVAFVKSVGMPTTLSEAGIAESDLPAIAKLVASEPMLQFASPKKANEEQALGILKKAF
ncbi:iron-containing alcohol dehydrogenase [Dehalobacter sp. DCM]|uniref:iron-containing alcohol dehydrogenase n=1 Tax=Dehalobacter sp. DCM TaxID=2907827 RepID=UPI0030819C33|nr:iron-containing alcohol dehydrogenase [Dehalobacter sp. DCM]